MNRPRLRRSAVAMAFASLAVLPAAVPRHATAEPRPAVVPRHAAVDPTDRSDWSPARWVVYLTNQERRQRGLVALRIVEKPTTAAQRQAKYQARADVLTHTGPGGGDAGDRLSKLGYPWAFWAENVAAGQRTASEVVRAWMNSDGHRASMLRPDARHIGVARATSDSGVPYWTMVIARRY